MVEEEEEESILHESRAESVPFSPRTDTAFTETSSGSRAGASTVSFCPSISSAAMSTPTGCPESTSIVRSTLGSTASAYRCLRGCRWYWWSMVRDGYRGQMASSRQDADRGSLRSE